MNLEQTNDANISYVKTDIHGKSEKLKINHSNIEYCEMTAITKELSFFNEIFSFFSNYEHDIENADNVILEFNSNKSNNDSELCEIKKSETTGLETTNSNTLCRYTKLDISL